MDAHHPPENTSARARSRLTDKLLKTRLASANAPPTLTPCVLIMAAIPQSISLIPPTHDSVPRTARAYPAVPASVSLPK
ncbi:hypothetical protein C8Q76DRAFT_16587 [Earliella scabrosa]|nr:hypothetical protein C8Q76DRAFT_16587 [Earliella scabrosa]